MRRSPPESYACHFCLSPPLAPIYIKRIFTVSRPDASIGSEISMPTYQARLPARTSQRMSYVVVNAKVTLTRSEIRLLIYLALIILCILPLVSLYN